LSLLDQRESHKIYKMTLRGLSEIAPAIDWDAVSGNGINDTCELIVSQPEFFAAPEFDERKPSAGNLGKPLKCSSYRGCLLNYPALCELTSGFSEGRGVGNSAQTAALERSTGVTDGASRAVGQMYVKMYFPPEAKQG